jgi:hypothetical protein
MLSTTGETGLNTWVCSLVRERLEVALLPYQNTALVFPRLQPLPYPKTALEF